MKNSPRSISLILTTGLAGVAFFSLAEAPFIAALPGDAILAIAVSAAIIGLAVYDYSRRVQPLTPPGRVLRPLPGDWSGQTPASQQAGTGRVANSFKSVHHDRTAA